MTTSISSSRAHHVGKESGLRNDAVEKPRQAEMPGRQKTKAEEWWKQLCIDSLDWNHTKLMKLLPLVILFKFFLKLEEVVLVGNKSRDKPVCITNLRNNPLNPINHPIFLWAAKLSYYERVNISPYSCSLVHPSIDSHLRRRRRRTSCITSNYNGWQTRVVMKKKKSRHVNNMISCQLCRHAQGFSSSVSCHQY